MTSLPRIACPECGGVYGGVPTRAIGMVAVRDHKKAPRSFELCHGSMRRIPLNYAEAWQEELPADLVALVDQSGPRQGEMF